MRRDSHRRQQKAQRVCKAQGDKELGLLAGPTEVLVTRGLTARATLEERGEVRRVNGHRSCPPL